MKIDIAKIEYSLRELDLCCDWSTSLKIRKDYQWFLKNEPERFDFYSHYDDGPNLTIKFCKDYAKISGSHLTKNEKKLIFPYCDYNTINEYADYLAEFIIKYFKSIKVKYVRQ